jgi:hypothetical protein
MMKAYDHVEWGYLYDCLCKLGFSMDWITTVMRCVTNVCYAVRIIGDLTSLMIQVEGLNKGVLSVPIYF